MNADFINRSFAAYLSEAFISLIVAVTLIYYFKVYRRQFLLFWALSWSVGVVNLLTLAALISGLYDPGIIRHALSFAATFSQSLQLLLLVLGSAVITFKRKFSRKQLVTSFVVLALIGVMVTWPYATDPNGGTERYALRVGFRYLSIFIGFVVAGYMVSRQQPFTKSLGRKLIATSFIVFGLYQLYYLAIVVGNIFGKGFPLPVIFGIVEIVLIALIGLSMIIYLLEQEHARVSAANEELASFLYRTSHDLRSPLATILSVLVMVKNYPEAVNPEQALAMIEDRAKKT